MQALRSLFDWIEPHVAPGGRYARWYPLYEGLESFCFTPATRTVCGPHVRDVLDLKRMMVLVVVALLPCIVMAMVNTGYQIHRAVEAGGQTLPGWQTTVYAMTGLPLATSSWIGNAVHGALYFLPVYLVTMTAGGLCEVVFSVVRKHPINEGFLVTSALIPLILPPPSPTGRWYWGRRSAW